MSKFFWVLLAIQTALCTFSIVHAVRTHYENCTAIKNAGLYFNDGWCKQ